MRSLRCMALVTLGAVMFAVNAQAQTCDWPLWQNYAKRFVQDDGRVLNSSMKPTESSSEGQSYAMFFALVGNDRASFDKLWTWTKANMSGSDISQNLPGWLWGKKADNTWGVIDQNSASDADLWMAYALLEAARVWNAPQYRADAQLLLANVERNLIVRVPGLGKMLLPGPVGYVHAGGLWRFNPSYQVLAQLRRFQKERPNAGWNEVAESNARMLADSANNPQTSNSARGDVNSVNLRSLGVGNTLVLLNGRRLVQHPTSQGTSDTGTVPVQSFNSNAVPVAGLDRVEVLLDGDIKIRFPLRVGKVNPPPGPPHGGHFEPEA